MSDAPAPKDPSPAPAGDPTPQDAVAPPKQASMRSCVTVIAVLLVIGLALTLLIVVFGKTFAINAFQSQLKADFDNSSLDRTEKALGKQLVDDTSRILRDYEEEDWSANQSQEEAFRYLTTAIDFLQHWPEGKYRQQLSTPELRLLMPLMEHLVDPETEITVKNFLVETSFQGYSAFLRLEIEESGLDASEKEDSEKVLTAFDQISAELREEYLSENPELSAWVGELNRRWATAVYTSEREDTRHFTGYSDESIRAQLFAVLEITKAWVKLNGTSQEGRTYNRTDSGALLLQADEYVIAFQKLNVPESPIQDRVRGLENLYQAVLAYRKILTEHPDSPEAETASVALKAHETWFALEEEARAKVPEFVETAQDFPLSEATRYFDEATALLEKYQSTTKSMDLVVALEKLERFKYLSKEKGADQYMAATKESQAAQLSHQYAAAMATLTSFINAAESEDLKALAEAHVISLERAASKWVQEELEKLEADTERATKIEAMRASVAGLEAEAELDAALKPDDSGD